MKNRKAFAKWEGGLKNGKGSLKFETLDKTLPYNFSSRFESGNQTNPEELIAAAHAGCFAMALSGILNDAGYEPQALEAEAVVTIEKADGGFRISKSALNLKGTVKGIDENEFIKLAEQAKAGCPVSKALAGIDITLEAHLNT
ncbi:MAG TPA: OsmC family protein [Mariniphaga sp.]|nr:OsmC family protein [Mariniphaga sp.]